MMGGREGGKEVLKLRVVIILRLAWDGVTSIWLIKEIKLCRMVELYIIGRGGVVTERKEK